MTTPLFDLLNDDGPRVYYSDGFRDVIENHLVIMREKHSSPVSIQQHIAYVYEADFYGLMNALGVAKHFQWITLRLNGYTSPTDYRPEDLVLYIPDINYVERLKDVFTTVQRIN